MAPSVYVETSVISYLAAWRSPQLLMAANQEATRLWWDEKRPHYDLFVSQAVLSEAAAGDATAARQRLEFLRAIPILEITEAAEVLSKSLMARCRLPQKAEVDALHIAVAAVQGMDFLLTWNCRHIANPFFRTRFTAICQSSGYTMPVICSPLELSGDIP